jgi:type VI secretion system secreted protein VgrG
VRVAQNWAGSTWGGQIIPRIGMEVMVAFVDGDPDRPLVTGVVPNARQTVPYELPANKTKSTFRTQTHKGQGFNELSFEDDAGREEIFVHAQRDMTSMIENNHTERVENHKLFSVKGLFVTEVESSKTDQIERNYSINVGSGNMLSGKNPVGPWGMRMAGYFLNASDAGGVGGGHFDLNASNTISLSATKGFYTDVMGVYVETIGLNRTTTIGGGLYQATVLDSRETVGTTKVIDAHESIHFRSGKAEIIMKSDGIIHIKGVKIEIEGSDLITAQSTKIELN